MSILTLPIDPTPASMGIALISAKNPLGPSFGGDEQELQRKGSKYALTFQMPPMTYLTSMDWDDLMCEGDTVLMRVFQPGFDPGAPGTPLVNGGAQSGTSLIVDGLTPYHVIRKGQFINVVTGGQHFLYRVAAEVVASNLGAATIPLRTMLRRPPSDNDVVKIAEPMIEGFVRDMGEYVVGANHLVGLQFTVRERE